MKRMNKPGIIALAVLFGTGALFAQVEKKLSKEFSGKKSVRIHTVSGDCIIKTHTGDKILVDLVYTASIEDAFKPEFRETGTTLVLKEDWRRHSSSDGTITWNLTLPAQTEIEFKTASGNLAVDGSKNSLEANAASGDLSISNAEGDIEISVASGDVSLSDVRGDLEISTASGDVEADKLQGEIEISTASGEIKITDSKGGFELSCASGEIEAKEIIIESESSFSTASGDVAVTLAKTSEHDLELSSASGSVILDYNGNPVKGTFAFSAKKRSGRIQSSVPFDKEEEFEQDDQVYFQKTFTRQGDQPKISLSTASGRITFK